MTRPIEFLGEPIPAFIPSVSSVKDDHSFDSFIALLEALGVPVALTSAYDWHHADAGRRDDALARYFDWRATGRRMVLDSGRYEAYWHRDAGWDYQAYLRVALELAPTWALTFDDPESGNDAEAHASVAIREWTRDQAALSGIPVVPIVHGMTLSLPAAVAEVARHTEAAIIAVPERDLGDGVIERARTVLAMRRRLDDAGLDRGIHLLGTGSPVSVLIYTLAGADSYDGLEWNRTSVDFETARLYHLQHFDFFEGQSAAGGSGSYWARALAHNLIFWRDWMNRIRTGDGPKMLREYLPADGCRLVEAALDEVLS